MLAENLPHDHLATPKVGIVDSEGLVNRHKGLSFVVRGTSEESDGKGGLFGDEAFVVHPKKEVANDPIKKSPLVKRADYFFNLGLANLLTNLIVQVHGRGGTFPA